MTFAGRTAGCNDEVLCCPDALTCTGPAGDSAGRFNGVLDCFVKTARQEGPLAFYKGFVPNFGRLGSWNVAMFLTLEQVGVQPPCTVPFTLREHAL